AAWRVYRFITDTRCYNKVETVEQARKAAQAFGSFLKMLERLPADQLHETIPNFHHTPTRVAALETAIREDVSGRASGVRAEIEFALDRRNLSRSLLDLHEAGLAPLRVAHNDTKLNNVLFDRATDEPVCVVDLDTVMPGLSFYDFGDLVRFACNSTDEDDPQTDRVEFRADVYDALIQGWLESAGDVFTPAETENLLLAGKVLTYECGIRFLADHLNGDNYFRIVRPGQNLDRCRTQFRMVHHMENRKQELEDLRLRILNSWKGQK
ncbi:MAG: aminoglycoside phosphotransferase family protein, partial [Kiritimatiellia bacterium]|nr:aminoglycoside phosphotransferase family protein [Kiritimatiellia bacterium]